jgi:hypothetical protein
MLQRWFNIASAAGLAQEEMGDEKGFSFVAEFLIISTR